VRASSRRRVRFPTVAFMGLDGSGKSTQADLLGRYVSARGGHWVTVHHSSTKVPGAAILKRRFHSRAIRILKRQGAHVQSGGTDRQQPGGGNALSWIISAYLVCGSFCKALWYRWRFQTAGVILDRCLLDDLIKVEWRFGCRAPAANRLLQLAPKPDLVIVLDGDPATTFERKKAKNCSYPEYLRKKAILQSWLHAAEDRGWTIRTVTITGKQIEEVHEMVLNTLFEPAGRGSELELRMDPDGHGPRE
jgi:thymidylate kinase